MGASDDSTIGKLDALRGRRLGRSKAKANVAEADTFRGQQLGKSNGDGGSRQ